LPPGRRVITGQVVSEEEGREGGREGGREEGQNYLFIVVGQNYLFIVVGVIFTTGHYQAEGGREGGREEKGGKHTYFPP